MQRETDADWVFRLIDNTTNVNNGPVTTIHHADNVNNGPVTTIHHADNVNIRLVSEDLALLESLPKQPDISTQWTDYMEGSRTKDINEIGAWVDSQATTGLLWIHAAAGLGKSTLARQLKHYLHSRNQLAAAIFLSQLPTDSLGPETIIKLIGGELGRTNHRAVPAIATAVRQSHGASVQVQLKSYVREPLLSLGLSHPLVVILDAIDEWRSHYHLVSELGHLTSHSSLIRFVVLSRSEPKERLYKRVSIQPYPLLPVSVEVMQGYLDARFENIEWEFGRKPMANDIVRLANMANGLFIWLSTACSLLEQSQSNPQNTLTAILHSRHTVGDTNHQLAMLYRKAIDQLSPQPCDKDELRTFLGCTIVLHEPLPLDAFSQLSGLSAYTVKRIALSLKALQIRQPVDSQAVVYPAASLFHASFLKYLQDTSIPVEIAFPIPSSTFHSQLGEACLRILTRFPLTSLDLDRLYLPPVCQYTVRYLAWHISRGMDMDESGKLQGSILQGGDTLALLQQWAPIFIRSLEVDVTSEPPHGDTVNTLLRAVAGLLDTAQTSAVVFKIPCLEIAVHISPDNAGSWEELGTAYSNQADVDDSLEFVQRAVVSYQHAVDIARGSQSEEHSSHVRTLANSLWRRFERTGAIEDLSKSLSLNQEILLLCPAGHPDRPISLNNLANSLGSRFSKFGAVDDLEEAILLEREALALRTPGHPDRPMSLNHLANSLHSRFEESGTVGDLEEAILLHREVLTLRTSRLLGRATYLNNLATSLHSRFEESGNIGDLEEAILLQREALTLCPSGHPNHPDSLNDLATSLHSHFEQSGTVGDLEEAILLQREALALRPSGHPNHPDSLNNLATSLQSRFEQSGTVGDLEEAILLYREALTLRTSDHPDHPIYLHNLATGLQSRFEQSGTVGDLEEATLLQREVLTLRSSGHPDHPIYLHNLATSLHSRFKQSGTGGDLEEAISLQREALTLRPSGHPDHPIYLHNLATSLQSRFEQSSTVGDLEEATLLQREALTLRPSGHPDHPIYLQNLATSLHSRFKQSGTVGDLEEAILLQREALTLRPSGHPDHPIYLHNLATSLQSRFEQSGNIGDLEGAILLQREALTLRPSGHPKHLDSLNVLAISLRSRFEESGSIGDLEEAIILRREALSLFPPGHSRRPIALWKLRLALYDRFDSNGTMGDFHEAISLAEEELSLYTPGNPDHNKVLEWLSSHRLVTSPP